VTGLALGGSQTLTFEAVTECRKRQETSLVSSQAHGSAAGRKSVIGRQAVWYTVCLPEKAGLAGHEGKTLQTQARAERLTRMMTGASGLYSLLWIEIF
jgi:hypothetical protein